MGPLGHPWRAHTPWGHCGRLGVIIVVLVVAGSVWGWLVSGVGSCWLMAYVGWHWQGLVAGKSIL